MMAIEIPGLVDLQVNGFAGIDFSDPQLDSEEAERACRELLQKGTSAFLVTVITSSMATYRRNLPILVGIMEKAEFQGRVLGFHLEGPFISPEPGAVGAHNPDWTQVPDIEVFKELYELANGKIKILTIAAELENACKLTKYASSLGVAVSLGHQLAEEQEFQKLAAAGAVSLTHFGNGIPNMLNRHRNPIWAGLANEELSAMLITDGHHLPPTVIKTMIKAKGIDKIIAVSDASPVAGCPPGRYNVLGNDAILEESGLLHNPEKACLVGSSATMLDCMNFLSSLGFLSLDEMLRVGFFNPLSLIGMSPEDVKSGQKIFFENSVFSIRA
jgi:N-acetylglucosamine-6-phosphate deacetylase